MSFPTDLDTFPDSTTLHGFNLDGSVRTSPSTNPYHATLHGNLGLAIAALEAKVGVDSSLVPTSHDYKLAALAATDVTLLTAILARLIAANNLSDLTNVPQARTNLGLGSAATANTGDFDAAGAAAAAQAASQPLDLDLTAIAALTTTIFGRSLLTQTDAAAARATIGAGTGSGDVVSVASAGSTITVTGTTAINVDFNLGHANTWTAAQTFQAPAIGDNTLLSFKDDGGGAVGLFKVKATIQGQMFVGTGTDELGTSSPFVMKNVNSTGYTGLFYVGSTHKAGIIFNQTDTKSSINATWASAVNVDLVLGGINTSGTYRETLTLDSTGGATVTAGVAGTVPLIVKGIASQSAPIIQLQGESSTTAGRPQAEIDTAWNVSTDATRSADLILRAYYTTTAQEGIRISASSSGPSIIVSGPLLGGNGVISAGHSGVSGSNSYFLGYQTLAAQVKLNSAGSNYGTVQNDNTGVWSLGYSSAGDNTLGTKVISWGTSGIGFNGSALVAKSTGWSVTGGYTPDKAFNPESTTLTEVARVLGTLVDYLISRGDIGA